MSGYPHASGMIKYEILIVYIVFFLSFIFVIWIFFFIFFYFATIANFLKILFLLCMLKWLFNKKEYITFLLKFCFAEEQKHKRKFEMHDYYCGNEHCIRHILHYFFLWGLFFNGCDFVRSEVWLFFQVCFSSLWNI